MKAPALLASLGALAAVALLAVPGPRVEPDATRFSPGAAQPQAVAAAPDSSPQAEGSMATRAAAAPSRLSTEPAPPVAPARDLRSSTRPSEAELLSRLVQKTYARAGGAVVDELVAHGLARSDGERIVREFFTGAAGCFFAALRAEAEARSLAYDPLLEALEAEIYDTDAALLTALIDMGAVATRASACQLTVAEQAGIPPSIMAAAARAAAR